MENEFRVWCKDNKKFEEQGWTAISNNGKLFHLHHVVNSTVQLVPLNKDTHIVEFYTGKKDKNREKIFEGDMVKTDDDEGVIRWDKKNTCFVCDMILGCPGRYINSRSMVVVGNIHKDTVNI